MMDAWEDARKCAMDCDKIHRLCAKTASAKTFAEQYADYDGDSWDDRKGLSLYLVERAMDSCNVQDAQYDILMDIRDDLQEADNTIPELYGQYEKRAKKTVTDFLQSEEGKHMHISMVPNGVIGPKPKLNIAKEAEEKSEQKSLGE